MYELLFRNISQGAKGHLEVSEEVKIVMLASTVISPKCIKKLPLKRTPKKQCVT